MTHLGLFIRFMDFGFQASTEYQQTDENATFKSDYSDFQVFFYQDSWGFDLIYQNYTGLSLLDYDRNTTTEVLPNMEIGALGVNLYFVFSPDYSLKKFSSPDRNSASQFGWIGLLSVKNHSMDSDVSLLPSFYPDLAQYTDMANLRQGSYTAVSAAFGFGFNAVSENGWYLNMVLMAGFGLSSLSESGEASYSKTASGTSYKANFKINMGYAGENWSFGVYGMADGEGYQGNDEFQRDFISVNASAYLGWAY